MLPPEPSAGSLDAYGEWEATLGAILKADGPIMIIGGTDVGKTTFTRLLVNRAVAAGKRVAVLDADPGQSEIGPPACVGLAFVEAPVTLLSDLTPNALEFVGSVSPAGRLLEHITAVRRLADMAAGRFLVIDTSGYLHAGARRLVQSEFDLVAPSDVVALQRDNELQGFLAPLRQRAGCRIHTPPVPAAIGAKPQSLRTQRRAMRFSAYLRDAKIAPYAFDDVAFTGTWLGGGTSVPAHMLRFLNETLGPNIRIYHAETSGRHLGLMTDRPITSHSPEMGIAMEQLRVREVSVTVAPRLKHLLIGLEASNGKLLGLGLLVSLDFRRGVAGVLTPVRSPDAACILQFGLQRISPDGSDAGALKPGEM
jgi:polynucleotide 5'-hydroxyl-kinase GRC3/NOL9